MPSAVRSKTRRLSIRLTEAEASLIGQAATILGRSETEFVGHAAVRAAEDVVDGRVIVLSEAGFSHFMELISRPPEVAPALVELMKRPAPWETGG